MDIADLPEAERAITGDAPSRSCQPGVQRPPHRHIQDAIPGTASMDPMPVGFDVKQLEMSIILRYPPRSSLACRGVGLPVVDRNQKAPGLPASVRERWPGRSRASADGRVVRAGREGSARPVGWSQRLWLEAAAPVPHTCDVTGDPVRVGWMEGGRRSSGDDGWEAW